VAIVPRSIVAVAAIRLRNGNRLQCEKSMANPTSPVPTIFLSDSQSFLHRRYIYTRIVPHRYSSPVEIVHRQHELLPTERHVLQPHPGEAESRSYQHGQRGIDCGSDHLYRHCWCRCCSGQPAEFPSSRERQEKGQYVSDVVWVEECETDLFPASNTSRIRELFRRLCRRRVQQRMSVP
jgi:hypothetical protein